MKHQNSNSNSNKYTILSGMNIPSSKHNRSNSNNKLFEQQSQPYSLNSFRHNVSSNNNSNTNRNLNHDKSLSSAKGYHTYRMNTDRANLSMYNSNGNIFCNSTTSSRSKSKLKSNPKSLTKGFTRKSTTADHQQQHRIHQLLEQQKRFQRAPLSKREKQIRQAIQYRFSRSKINSFRYGDQSSGAAGVDMSCQQSKEESCSDNDTHREGDSQQKQRQKILQEIALKAARKAITKKEFAKALQRQQKLEAQYSFLRKLEVVDLYQYHHDARSKRVSHQKQQGNSSSTSEMRKKTDKSTIGLQRGDTANNDKVEKLPGGINTKTKAQTSKSDHSSYDLLKRAVAGGGHPTSTTSSDLIRSMMIKKPNWVGNVNSHQPQSQHQLQSQKVSNLFFLGGKAGGDQKNQRKQHQRNQQNKSKAGSSTSKLYANYSADKGFSQKSVSQTYLCAFNNLASKGTVKNQGQGRSKPVGSRSNSRQIQKQRQFKQQYHSSIKSKNNDSTIEPQQNTFKKKQRSTKFTKKNKKDLSLNLHNLSSLSKADIMRDGQRRGGEQNYAHHQNQRLKTQHHHQQQQQQKQDYCEDQWIQNESSILPNSLQRDQDVLDKTMLISQGKESQWKSIVLRVDQDQQLHQQQLNKGKTVKQQPQSNKKYKESSFIEDEGGSKNVTYSSNTSNKQKNMMKLNLKLKLKQHKAPSNSKLNKMLSVQSYREHSINSNTPRLAVQKKTPRQQNFSRNVAGSGKNMKTDPDLLHKGAPSLQDLDQEVRFKLLQQKQRQILKQRQKERELPYASNQSQHNRKNNNIVYASEQIEEDFGRNDDSNVSF